MEQKSFPHQAPVLIRKQRRRRRWQKAVTGMAAVVVFVTTYLLILPAITMQRNLLYLEPELPYAALGDAILVNVSAEADSGQVETVFFLSADGENAGLDERLLSFDGDGIALLTDQEGRDVELHREYENDGAVNYWFSLPEGAVSHFALPWVNGVDRLIQVERPEEPEIPVPPAETPLPTDTPPAEEPEASAPDTTPGTEVPEGTDTPDAQPEPDQPEEMEGTTPPDEVPEPPSTPDGDDSSDPEEVITPPEEPPMETAPQEPPSPQDSTEGIVPPATSETSSSEISATVQPQENAAAQTEPVAAPLSVRGGGWPSVGMAAHLSAPVPTGPEVRLLSAETTPTPPEGGDKPSPAPSHEPEADVSSSSQPTEQKTESTPVPAEPVDSGFVSVDEELDDPREDELPQWETIREDGAPDRKGKLTISFGSGADLKEAQASAGRGKNSLTLNWLTQEELAEMNPRITLTAQAGDVTVVAAAAPGVLPEGTSLVVTPLEWEETDLLALEPDQASTEILSVHLYDISFVDGDGQPVEPEGNVTVTMTFHEPVASAENGMRDSGGNSRWELVHISGDLDVERLSQRETTQIQTNAENAVERVEFQSRDFSVYALLETGESRAKENITVNGTSYIAVPNASVTVNGKNDSASAAEDQLINVDILFDLGTTSDSRSHFYYGLPEGIEVPDCTNRPLTDASGETLGTYSYQEVNGKPYLLLDITKHSTNMSGGASFGAKFSEEGKYKFEGGPTVTVFPETIDKNKLDLNKTAGDAVQNEDGSWTWIFTVTIQNTGDTPMKGIVLKDRMELVDQGIRIIMGEVSVASSPNGSPAQFGTPTEDKTGVSAATVPMDIPAGATYTYSYPVTLSAEDARKVQESGGSLSYENTAQLTTEDGTLIREVRAQIAYVTAADIFEKNGTLPDDENSHVEWRISLNKVGKHNAAGSPIKDTLNREAYEKGDLYYITENSGPYQPYVEVYQNGRSVGTQELTWVEIDSLEDASQLTDYTKLYYCENEFYWPGMESQPGDTGKYGFELHYWTNYPKNFSQYGQNMNQAQSNFKGIPIGVTGNSDYHAETVLTKELTSLRNNLTADWKVDLKNSSTQRHYHAFIWDELPNSGSSKDNMEKLSSYPSSNPVADDGKGNYFWVFDSVEKLEEVTGIRITVRDNEGHLLNADEVLLRSPNGKTPAYIGFGYYSWASWKIYPNLYGTTDEVKKLFAEAAAGTAEKNSGRWYYENDVYKDLAFIVEGSADAYLPSSGNEDADLPDVEGYVIQLDYRTDCTQEPSQMQKRRTNLVHYYGEMKDLSDVKLSADASYYLTASQELQPVQKSLGEVEMLEDGSIKLTYLALLDNRYRTTMTTKDQWVDELTGVDGAYYVQDSLKIYRAAVHFEPSTNRWKLDRVGSVAQLDESKLVNWAPAQYPTFLQVEQGLNSFTLTLSYDNADELYEKEPQFAGYAADFKNPNKPTPETATKASFYLCYDVIVPADAVSELENNAVLRNTIQAYTAGEPAGSSYVDYALDAAELSKTIIDAPIYDNGYTATFQLNVLVTEDLAKLNQFSIVDILSDTLNLDVKSIQVYGIEDDGTEVKLETGYQTYVEGQTLTLLMKRGGDAWGYDRYKVTYQAKINGVAGDKVSFENTAVIPEIGGTPQVAGESVFINQAGAVVEQARVEIFKYDGDDAKLALPGAEFVLAPLKENVQQQIVQAFQENGPISQEEFNQYLDELTQDGWDIPHGFRGKTDDSGSLEFIASEGNAIYANRIYCLKEIVSPEGYLLQDGGYRAYFMIYQSTSDQDGVIKTYLAPYVPKKGLSIQYQVPNYKASFNVYKVSSLDAEEYLAGAEFTLYQDKDCTEEIAKGVLTEDKNGILCYYFGGLDTNKTFYLKETKAPDSFILDDTVYTVSIGKDGTVTFSANGKPVELKDNGLTVENAPSLVLPETGGTGTLPLTTGGLILLLLACLMYRYQKRWKEGCGS